MYAMGVSILTLLSAMWSKKVTFNKANKTQIMYFGTTSGPNIKLRII